ncbi:MAG: hypothetical protein ACI841_002034 [Planctomycetota bacterium]|jgi:hypothetical protein
MMHRIRKKLGSESEFGRAIHLPCASTAQLVSCFCSRDRKRGVTVGLTDPWTKPSLGLAEEAQ